MEFTKQSLPKKIRIFIGVVGLCVCFYQITFGNYFDAQSDKDILNSFLSQIRQSQPSIINAKFASSGFEITLDVKSPIDKIEFKTNIINQLCSHGLIGKKTLNINVRFSRDVRYEQSGNLLGSWLVFKKDCT
jgi:hypothetical protein